MTTAVPLHIVIDRFQSFYIFFSDENNFSWNFWDQLLRFPQKIHINFTQDFVRDLVKQKQIMIRGSPPVYTCIFSSFVVQLVALWSLFCWG